MALIIEKCLGTVGRMWGDVFYKGFTDSLVELMLYSQRQLCQKDEYIHYAQGCASYHFLGRNQLAANFKGDWILMVDGDHSFAPDLLVRLLDLKNRTNSLVVSGIYQIKAPPHRPVVNFWGPDGNSLIPLMDWDRSLFEFEVGTVGGGALLIDKKVFQILAAKFPNEEPFDQIGKFSEDYSFCRRCRDAGIPIILGSQLETHHLITTALSVEDYVPPSGQSLAAQIENGKIKS